MAGLNLIPVRAVRQTAKKAVLRLNYLAGRYTETVWLIGDGRSGTTWISNVIGVSRGYREVFEPFHPGSVAEFRFMPLNLYRAPDQDDQRLKAAAARVFDGRFMHPRSDRDNRRRLLYRGLLVKDIFAMLFARWATLRFPQVKPVLVIRNPFAVARSKRARRGWHWMENPTDFLRQPRLVVDHLADKSDVLRQVEAEKNDLLNQIAIWSVLYSVVLRQFPEDAIHIMFYEDMVRDPAHEITRLAAYLGREPSDFAGYESLAELPSNVSTEESVRAARSEAESKSIGGLTPAEVRAGQSILAEFDLDHLYGATDHPRP